MRSNRWASTVLAVAFVVTMCTSADGLAEVTWDWSNAGTGTEQGTITTDGGLVGGSAPAGTYTVSGFSLTASGVGLPLGSVADGTYIIPNQDIGFMWNGAAPTQFFRDSGFYTNGFGFELAAPGSGTPAMITFALDFFEIMDIDEEETFLFEDQTVNLAPAPVPEPASLGFVGLAALALRRRR